MISAAGLAATPPAVAQPRHGLFVDTTGQSLWAALSDLAQRTGTEVVMGGPIPRALAAPPLRGRYTFDEALVRLLRGTGLTYRRTPDGAYLIMTPAAEAAAPEISVTVPELLVLGKRTQNADIPRRENDIQPYKVWSARAVEQSHSTDIQEFLRASLTSNAVAASPIQSGSASVYSARSEVDLRGLGSGQTLILVDGRRMPGLPVSNPSIQRDILQGDLNGIPLSAIARVEVLNSTAGGVYGPGATAGVVNVVLKRDYRGAELGMSYGVSDRGDAATRKIDGRMGYTSDDGRTQLMVAFSRASGADLRDGDRDFADRAIALRAANEPKGPLAALPFGNAINIRGYGPLVLDPAYGGANLGATTTFLPLSDSGLSAGGIMALVANAGHFDSSLPQDTSGTDRSLLVRPTSSSWLINVRRRWNGWLETYSDLMILQDVGWSMQGSGLRSLTLTADNPLNPFQQIIDVTLPLPGWTTTTRNRARTIRATAGLIADLPAAWEANFDYSLGRAEVAADLDRPTYGAAAALAILHGNAGPAGQAPLSVFGGQAAFLAGLDAYRVDIRDSWALSNHFGDLSGRLAGPVLQLAGGPMTLSMLAETRRENLPTGYYREWSSDGQTATEQPLLPVGLRTITAYAELRAPLIDRYTGPPGLRGLELQLALRRDAIKTRTPANQNAAANDLRMLTSKQNAATYTAGLKVFPINAVMLRASVATGTLPPTVSQLDYASFAFATTPELVASSAASPTYLDPSAPPDPKRAGEKVGSQRVVTVGVGGSSNLRAETAQSLSAGLVLAPPGVDRLRLSLDYTRIDKRNEIGAFHNGEYTYFLNHEDQFPGHVMRAPLTNQDRAKGYTVGAVQTIDAGTFNVGRTRVEAVDFQADYAMPTQDFGDFGAHAAATWQPRLTRELGPGLAPVNYAGFANGPLAWRGNGGVDWTHGQLNLGFNAYYYAHYRVAGADDLAAAAANKVKLQGASHIPSQIYVDVYLARRVILSQAWGGLRSLDLKVGVHNLFDHRPPTIADASSVSYSTYGDPRLRRFELSLVGGF